MYTDTIDQLAKVAATKVALLKRNPLGFFIGAMKAGAHIGLGTILIFVLGSDVAPA